MEVELDSRMRLIRALIPPSLMPVEGPFMRHFARISRITSGLHTTPSSARSD